ncbi:MAG: NAD(P)-binding domain-containing protein [Ramlibacter sp.]|nr:NAD(P)-binding domain-containing protein [Ramlibacter sp.]
MQLDPLQPPRRSINLATPGLPRFTWYGRRGQVTYGLSLASHLRFLGVPFEIVGTPMALWKPDWMPLRQMRSTLANSCPSNPEGTGILQSWVAGYVPDIGQRKLRTLFSTEYVVFMRSFANHFDIAADEAHVEALEQDSTGFRARLANGRTIAARQVVVATGVAGTETLPRWAAEFPDPAKVMHSSRAAGFDAAGKRVLVIGAGQTAAEACIDAAGKGAAAVDMAFRAKAVVYSSMHDEPTLERQRREYLIRNAFIYSGEAWRTRNVYTLLPRSIEPVLAPALAACAALKPGTEVVSARLTGGGEVEVAFEAGGVATYDAVLCATGFRPGIGRLPFALSLQEPLAHHASLPLLDESGESSTPGMFFTGAWAALRFGPQSNVVFGTEQMVGRLVGRIARLG